MQPKTQFSTRQGALRVGQSRHSTLWICLLIVSALLGVTAPREAAAQVTWTGTSADWGLSTNWTPATTLANSGTYSLAFAGTPSAVSSTNTLTSLVLGTGSTNAIRFDTSGFTLGGSAITLSSTIANLAATGTNTINLGMSVAATRTITGTGGSTLVLGGNISGAGGLSFARTAGSGPANFILSGSNDFTGGFTTLGAGNTNFTITNPNAFGRNVASNKLTFTQTTITNNAGALVLANNVDFNANASIITLNLAGGSLELTGSTGFLGAGGTGLAVNSGTVTIRQITSGSGANGGQLGGSGTIVVSQSSSGYTGNWRTSTGTGWLLIGDAAALGSGTFQFSANNAIGLGTTRDLTISTNLSTSAGGRIGGDYALTVDKPIVGSGGLSKVGSGTLSLTANNTFSGAMSVSQGVLRLTGSNSLSGVTLNGTSSGVSAVSFESANALGTSGVLTYNGVTSGTALIRNLSGAPVTLASTGAFTTNNLGTLAFDGPSALTISSGTWTFQMPTVNVVSSTLTLAGSGTGAATWTKTGAGTLRLSGSNSFTGAMQVGEGVVLLDNAFAVPGGTGVRGSGAPIRFFGGPGGVLGLTSGTFALAVNKLANLGGVSFTNSSGTNGSGGGFAGFASGSTVYVALTVGGTTGAPLQFGVTADFLASGTTLILGASNATGTVDFQNPLNLNNAQQFIRADDGAAAVDGILSGIVSNGQLTKTGLGTLGLTANNTFGGVLTVSQGTVEVASVNNASANGPLGNSGSAVVLGSAGNIGSLFYTGGSAASSKAFTAATGGTAGFVVNNAATTLTLSGAIGGSGDVLFSGPGSVVLSGVLSASSLFKTGTGTLSLGGANTYLGDTTIAFGTLKLASGGSFANSSRIIVGGSGSSGVTLDLTDKTSFSIGSSQTLQGIGTAVLGPTTAMTVSGLFSPGNSPGLFTYSGGSTTLSGTTLLEIWGTTRSTGYDAVDVTSSALLNLGGQLILDFNQNFADTDTFLLFETLTGGSLVSGFSGITITGSNNDYTGLSFVQSGNVWTTGFNGNNQSLRLTQTASTVTLSVIIVPEPDTIIFAGIGIALAGWTVWKRRRIAQITARTK